MLPEAGDLRLQQVLHKVRLVALRRLLTLESGKRRPWVRTVPPESHHDLLEVERGATDEDVRRAYKRAKDVYDPKSIAAYGLFTPDELKALSARLDEAFDVLLDPSRRKPYELSIFPPEPHVELARPERSLDSDPELKGRIGYRCLKARDGTDYYHLATPKDDEAAKILQTRAFFADYTAKTRHASNNAVEVVPLEVIAETA